MSMTAMMPILNQVKFGSRYKSGFPGLLAPPSAFVSGQIIPFAARQLRRGPERVPGALKRHKQTAPALGDAEAVLSGLMCRAAGTIP
jgi:hypothetical protein